MVDFRAFNPSPKALRLIANYIGVLSQEDTIEFLGECSVTNDLIEQQESSSKVIYHIFKKLASSDKETDHTLLVKIIADSTNPALYNQPGLTEDKVLETYNGWLKWERLHLVDFDDSGEYKITSYIPTSSESEASSLKEAEYENDILKSIVKPYAQDIAEIKTAYRLLLQLVDVFSQKSFPVDQQLNNYYMKLFVFIENKVDDIHSAIENVYEQENQFDTPPSFYIQPYLYKDSYGKPVLFRPITNLYLAGKEMEEQGLSWSIVKRNMETCLGFIEKTFYTFEANKTNTFPHQAFFNEVTTYLKHLIKIDYNDFFGFEGTKFWLKRIAAENLTISFHPKKGETTNPLCLLNACVDYLKKNGTYSNGRLSTIVPNQDITAYIKANYPKVNLSNWEYWIKNTKNSLLQKMTDEDKKFITIDYHDKKIGYPFSIKLPLNNSLTP